MLIHLYLSVLCLITITAMVFLSPFLPAVDQVVYQMNKEFLSEGHITFMKQITHLGDGEFYVVVCALVFFYFLFLQRFKPAMIVALFSAFTRAVNPFLKTYFMRDRPISTVSEASGYSFPSGHSANIAFLVLLIYSLLPPNAQQDYRTRIILSILIFLVGLSRISLEVHWMSDVLAGWSLGLALGLLCLYFQRKVEE